jgi:hypothetical protein
MAEGTTWPARFERPETIRRLGAIEYVACRAEDGTPRLLVVASPGAPREATGELLAEIARVHRLIDHPKVPKVAEVDDAPLLSWIALDSAAIVDFETLSGTVIETAYPVDHRGGGAHVLAFAELLDVVHKIIDPETKRPICMGAFSAVNVLADAEGNTTFLGFGHPWRSTVRNALLELVPHAFLAHEATFGILPSPGGDVAALSFFLHSFERLGDMPREISRCLAGDTSAQSLSDKVLSLLQNTQAARPADRSMRRFIDDFRAVLELLDLPPSDEIFANDLRAVVEASQRSGSRAQLVVARDGRWCKPPNGDVVQLERRGAMRRLLVALTEARRDTPGLSLSWEQLLKAGWPDENPRVDAGKNRVYVTVAQLRALGLRNVLTSTDAGYMLDPDVAIVWADTPTNA